MSGITYAHPSCFYCQGWASEAETEANRRPDAEAAQVGDDHHWARYYKDPTQAPTHGAARHESETEMTEHEPMTQEQLDAIQARVDGATNGPWGCYGDGAHEVFDAGEYGDGDRGEVVAAVIDRLSDAVFIANAREDIPALLAEVQRLRHFESIVSWRYGDTTDGRTREDMMERAARAVLRGDEAITGEYTQWDNLPEGIRENYRRTARTALDAALGTGEGA